MFSRAAVSLAICVMLVWTPISGLAEDSPPLSLEYEWSNAMYYTDRHVITALGSAVGGTIAMGFGALALATGWRMAFPRGDQELGQTALGAGLSLLGAGGLLGGLWLAIYSAGYSYVYISQRTELLATGDRHGWVRDRNLIEPIDPQVRILVKPSDTPYDWLRLFSEFAAESP